MSIKAKTLALAALTALAITPATAANLSSVTCSLNSIVLTFDQSISADDVTLVEIGETSTAKLKYELDLLPGSISGAVLTLTTDATAQSEIRKVSPYKAHVFVTGDASGTQKCND